MTRGITSKMNMIQASSSILVLLISLTSAIRVDWNTNKGPIVPPVPTQQPKPQPPFRAPAPVWEDQSDDIPNPNPYRYVLPPPSRPRPTVDNYLRAPLYNHNYPQRNYQNIGQVISNPSSYQSNIVPSLGVQYIPNVGPKYSAVVPQKSYYLDQNDIYDHKYEKPSERYNAKLKKYKAYEQKLKYYDAQSQSKQSSQYNYAVQPQQQLPFLQPPQPFRLPQAYNDYQPQQQLPYQQKPTPFNSQWKTESNINFELQQLPLKNEPLTWNQNWNMAPQTFNNPTQQSFTKTETTTALEASKNPQTSTHEPSKSLNPPRKS